MSTVHCKKYLLSKKAPVWLTFTPYGVDDYSGKMVKLFSESAKMADCHFIAFDVFGTGNTPGVWRDEYTKNEQKLVEKCARWVLRQEWCDGKLIFVGMSYSGCVSLQYAEKNPVHKCIILFAGLDNKNNDVWLSNGVPLLADLYGYALSQQIYVLDDEKRSKTIKNVELVLQRRLSRGAWKSVTPELVTQNCGSVLCVSGWADSYVSSCFNIYEKSENTQLFIGPWEHNYPMYSSYGQQVNLGKIMASNSLPSFCVFLLSGLSCKEGVWFMSEKHVSPKYHKFSVNIGGKKLTAKDKPLITNTFLFETSCENFPAKDTIGVNVKNIQNICGNIFLEISCLPKTMAPFMVYIILRRGEKENIISHCIYNPAIKRCQAKSIGVIIEKSDKILVAFDMNSFPYTWIVKKPVGTTVKFPKKSKLSLFFTEYSGLEKTTFSLHKEKMVDTWPRLSWLSPDSVIIRGEDETLMATNFPDNVSAKSIVKYPNSRSKTFLQSEDGGKTFLYETKIVSHGKEWYRSGTWRTKI